MTEDQARRLKELKNENGKFRLIPNDHYSFERQFQPAARIKRIEELYYAVIIAMATTSISDSDC
jgi:hypothetical protein